MKQGDLSVIDSQPDDTSNLSKKKDSVDYNTKSDLNFPGDDMDGKGLGGSLRRKCSSKSSSWADKSSGEEGKSSDFETTEIDDEEEETETNVYALDNMQGDLKNDIEEIASSSLLATKIRKRIQFM